MRGCYNSKNLSCPLPSAMAQEKYYFLLRDTFGDGLEPFKFLGIDTFPESELVPHLEACIREILKEDGYNSTKEYLEDVSWTFAEEICVYEDVENVDGLPLEDYIKRICRGLEEKLPKVDSDDDEYKTYLRLKEKYES
jgi:hypothetical protein